jgi:hypothetical protein
MKAQGLPISTVVLIVLGVTVLIAVIIFFLSGMGSGQSGISTFQCQQMCETINTLIQGKQICCGITDASCLKGVTSINSFCSGKCNTKITCAMPKMVGCDKYDTSTCSNPILNCSLLGTPQIVGCT